MEPFTAARPYEIDVTTEVLAALARVGTALRHLHDNDRVDDEMLEVHQNFTRELIATHRDEGHPAGLIEVALGADPYAGTVTLDPVSVNEYVRQLDLARAEYPEYDNPFASMVEVLTERGGQPVASN